MRKRRWPWILLGSLIIALIVGVASGGSDSSSDSSTATAVIPVESSEVPASADVDTVTGLSQHAEDVSIIGCDVDSIGWGNAKIMVRNQSGKTSTYSITIAFESASGAQQYGTGFTFVSDLRPGQTVVDEVSSLGNAPTGVTCRLTEAERHAA